MIKIDLDQVPTCPFPLYSSCPSPDQSWRDLLQAEEHRGGLEGDQGQEQGDRGGAGDPAGTLSRAPHFLLSLLLVGEPAYKKACK